MRYGIVRNICQPCEDEYIEHGGIFSRKPRKAAAKIKNCFALHPGSESTIKTRSGGDLMALNHPCAVSYPTAALVGEIFA